MNGPLAQYACDNCRSRKVACSRERTGCQRCTTEGVAVACTYSRSGVMRRRRKEKLHQRSEAVGAEDLQQSRPLATDIAPGLSTQERLHSLFGRNDPSVRQLTSLLEEYAGAWQTPPAFARLAEGAADEFFLFDEQQTGVWLDGISPLALITTLRKDRLLLDVVPSDVLAHLGSLQPHQVQDRAWLVMFYSIALRVESSAAPSNESSKARLRSNLFLALNNVRLVLEPAVSSIQALIIMACYADECMTPQFCWSLVSQACIMLQALGVSNWRLDSTAQERRAMLFWRLNVLDKALALILGKPPTLHREAAASVAVPTLDQLLLPQSQRGEPVLFDAHYSHQMILLSRIMGNIWHCLHGLDAAKAADVKEDLEKWYSQAKEVLEAASLAEKPLLNASGVEAVNIGLRVLHFHHLNLVVLLTASSQRTWAQSLDFSQEMLELLPYINNATEDITDRYMGLLWQRLHCPLTAFGFLWGKLVVRPVADDKKSKRYLEAIEHVPLHLSKCQFRNPVVAKLQSITERFVQHATTVLASTGKSPQLCAVANARPNLSTTKETAAPSPDLGTLGEVPVIPYDEREIASNLSSITEDDGSQVQMEFDGFFDTTFEWFPFE